MQRRRPSWPDAFPAVIPPAITMESSHEGQPRRRRRGVRQRGER
jgi:hypothetical protein